MSKEKKRKSNIVGVTVNIGSIDVDVDLADFSDSDLIEELEHRDYVVIEKSKKTEYALSIFSKDELKSILELIEKSDNSSYDVELLRNKIVWSI